MSRVVCTRFEVITVYPFGSPGELYINREPFRLLKVQYPSGRNPRVFRIFQGAGLHPPLDKQRKGDRTRKKREREKERKKGQRKKKTFVFA